MILDSRSGLRGVVINWETGQRIPFVIWCDTDLGAYEAWKATPDGRAIATPREKVRGQARIKFVPFAGREFQAAGANPAPSTPAPAHHPAGCRGAALAYAGVEECEQNYCHRRAVWVVQDWRQIEPEKGADGLLYDKAELLVRHFYCDRHYRNPVEVSQRGVENEVEVQVARPQ